MAVFTEPKIVAGALRAARSVSHAVRPAHAHISCIFMHRDANANPKTLLAKNPLRALEMCVNKSVFDSEVGQ